MSRLQYKLNEFRQLLTTRLSEGELRTLCFDLQIDYDNLAGDTKADKVRELLIYAKHRNIINSLSEIGKEFRADIPWDEYASIATPAKNSIQDFQLSNSNLDINSVRVEQGSYFTILYSTYRFMAEAIHQVAYAASTDKKRLILTSVNFKIDNELLILTATDGYRLAYRKIALKAPTNSLRDFSLPATELRELFSRLNETEDKVTFNIIHNNDYIEIIIANHKTRLHVLKDEFPDIKQIISTYPNTTAVVQKIALIKSLKNALATEDNVTKLGLNSIKNTFTINSKTDKYIDVLDATINGFDVNIIVNGTYVIEALEAIASTDICLEIGSPITPCSFKPVDNHEVFHFVMPMANAL